MEKKRILAVDDISINLSVLEQALQEEYDIIPVISGKRALKFLGRQTPDLILLDVKMPEMDGVETLRQLRELENGRDIPVIFLTGTDDEEAAAQGRQYGIADFITKPFNDDDLKARIRRALGEG